MEPTMNERGKILYSSEFNFKVDFKDFQQHRADAPCGWWFATVNDKQIAARMADHIADCDNCWITIREETQKHELDS
jgi:hypothetical protein